MGYTKKKQLLNGKKKKKIDSRYSDSNSYQCRYTTLTWVNSYVLETEKWKFH